MEGLLSTGPTPSSFVLKYHYWIKGDSNVKLLIFPVGEVASGRVCDELGYPVPCLVSRYDIRPFLPQDVVFKK